jgi:membrane-anchored mycosin MYCP
MMTESQPAQQITDALPEIIVALPHQRVVTDALQDARVRFDEPEPSQDLGLARIRLRNARRSTSARAAESAAESAAQEASEKLIDSVPTEDLPARAQELLDEAEKKEGLDQTFLALRAVLASRYVNWSPTIGKNRILGRVWGGDGVVHHGDGGPPALADPPPEMTGDRGVGPGQGVRVGLVDTAFSPRPWLAGGWAAGYADPLRIPPAEEPYPGTAGHATFLTGLILGQAPGATVELRRVLDDTGSSDSWTVANAIVALGRSGVDIMNLSLMCYTEDDQPPLVMSTAIDRLDRKIVVVAAAGNHGDPNLAECRLGIVRSKLAWPAALDDVVAVGACDRDAEIAEFTPPNAPWIDFLAPGVDVVSTYLVGTVLLGEDNREDFHGFAEWTGTSFGAALITGTIAASTVPGRVTARQALDAMRRFVDDQHDANRRIGTEDYLPPVVHVAVPYGDDRRTASNTDDRSR